MRGINSLKLVLDWGMEPGDFSNAEITESKGPNDFRIYNYQRWVREAGFRSLYIDENYLGDEGNWLTGNAYFLPDGRLQRAYSYLGLRDYYKRMMIMFYQNHVPQPNLWMHISSGAAYYAWFGNIYFEGENVEPTNLQYDYMEVLPASRMRAIGSSVCSGGVMTMMCQSERHQSQWHLKHTHQFIGWVMAHDIIPEQRPEYTRFMEEGHLYRDDVVFQPYWKADSPCRTATKDCIVSAHKSAGHAILWIVNTARNDQNVEVTIDYAKLGAGDFQHVTAANAESGTAIQLTAKGFTVPVTERDFVAVQLAWDKDFSKGDTFIANFEKDARADVALGSDAFELEHGATGAQPERCSGRNGFGLNSSHGVYCSADLNLTDTAGQICFSGLVSDVATGAVLRFGSLSVVQNGGNTPSASFCLGAKKADFAKLTPGWHSFALSWNSGAATLKVDGTVAATIDGGGNYGGNVYFGSEGGVLPAIDDVRLNRSAD